MPVLVENALSGPTVFTDPLTGEQVEWKGKGDPAGGDVRHVSDKLATENVAFLEALRKGLFTIIEAPDDVKEKLEASSKTFKEREEATKKAAQESIDQAPRNDFVKIECIGPSERGTGQCGESVVLKEREVGDKPPLCPKHQHLAPEYVATEITEGPVNPDKPNVRWTRSQMTAPERQPQ